MEVVKTSTKPIKVYTPSKNAEVSKTRYLQTNHLLLFYHFVKNVRTLFWTFRESPSPLSESYFVRWRLQSLYPRPLSGWGENHLQPALHLIFNTLFLLHPRPGWRSYFSEKFFPRSGMGGGCLVKCEMIRFGLLGVDDW